MFVANPDEVAELILSSRRDTAKVKSNSVVRFMSNKSHSTTANSIAKPLSGLYLIPENAGGLRQLKWLATKETWDEQDRPYNLFLKAVGNLQIIENDTICLKSIIEFKRIYKQLLPEAIKWETADKITPIFLGYLMDLQKISELYFFYVEKECNGVATASDGTQQDNLAIFCWDWQKEYYVRLFPDAIYYLTEDVRTI